MKNIISIYRPTHTSNGAKKMYTETYRHTTDIQNIQTFKHTPRICLFCSKPNENGIMRFDASKMKKHTGASSVSKKKKTSNKKEK